MRGRALTRTLVCVIGNLGTSPNSDPYILNSLSPQPKFIKSFALENLNPQPASLQALNPVLYLKSKC